jgi:hypothetical protein
VIEVRWTGGTSVNREVGAATGKGDVIEHGSTHTVPAELAERLLASSTAWQRVRVKTTKGR